jgi:hypothetical protein
MAPCFSEVEFDEPAITQDTKMFSEDPRTSEPARTERKTDRNVKRNAQRKPICVWKRSYSFNENDMPESSKTTGSETAESKTAKNIFIHSDTGKQQCSIIKHEILTMSKIS